MKRMIASLWVCVAVACDGGTGQQLLPPYDGPLQAGQESPGFVPGARPPAGPGLGATEQPSGVIITADTPAYYNESLGNLLDGTDPIFLPAGNAPIFQTTAPPSLAAAADVLGPWLTTHIMPPNTNWKGPMVVPHSWPVTHDNAIIYVIENPGPRSWRLVGSFGVDNGMAVWLNGAFVFAAVAEGYYTPDEYPDIDLGVVGPGVHYLQVIRADHSGVNGYTIEVTAEVSSPY